MGGATKEHSSSTAQSLSRNRYTPKPILITATPCGLKFAIRQVFIVPVPSQPRGAEQRPCTHDRRFPLVGPDHTATEALLSAFSNMVSGLPVDKNVTGYLSLAHSRTDRLEEQLPCPCHIAGLNSIRCSHVFSSNQSCIKSAALIRYAQQSLKRLGDCALKSQTCGHLAF